VTVLPVLVRVSVGELLDKLVILELKASRIPGMEQQRNIRTELQLLRQSFAELELASEGVEALVDGLRRVNAELWQIEDEIRGCENEQRFDDSFVALARSVYRKNDERAELKRSINELCGSQIKEEKHYRQYARPEASDASAPPSPETGG
jgi:uncharacterized protein DUF6165